MRLGYFRSIKDFPYRSHIEGEHDFNDTVLYFEYRVNIILKKRS